MSISTEHLPQSVPRLPGDLAMWFFILMELTVFGLLLLAFAGAQVMQPELFQRGREELDSRWGMLLTFSLLTSGLFAALAVHGVRQSRLRLATSCLLAALLTAGGYVGLKLHEYAHLASRQLDIEHDTFFTLYWSLTGFHFLHVLLGMLILAVMTLRCARGRYGPENCSGLESGTLYWHMVDLVWVLVFLLVYVLH
ncbi:cytochrome c oxidase subunit 3 [Pseudomonas jinjuensis]|uniref:Nitric oxide reductase NorE protein n=1 Tax=Pseudomonas jinjuensis TaxID=198616 RepID=A0A1H0IUV6_9PSED|nr:cytochrome c oxidase subunit 3 [Pseudomonas jinjuensis]SDO34821.1 nitric oxide reductase NorE protein [Pseudomonas jinjuensis]